MTIPPEHLPLVTQRFQETQDLVGWVVRQPVDTPEAESWSVHALRGLQAQRKLLEEALDKIVAPAKASIKAAKEVFAPALDQLDLAKANIKDKLKAYRDRVEDEHTEALSQATTHEQLSEVVQALAPRPKGLIRRSSWSARVTDPDKLPRWALVPDTKKLNAMARAQKGDFDVPGAEAVETVQEVVR